MCLSSCIVETSMERSDSFKRCWIAMLVPISAVTASDQALTVCLGQPQHQPRYGWLPMAPNLVCFPPGTMCWRIPCFRFAFKKKKTFFHFSIQISEKKKIISDGRHPPAGNRHWLWAHAMGWLKRSNAGIGWVAQGGPDKLPVAQEDIWEEHPSSWSQAAFASCLFKT